MDLEKLPQPLIREGVGNRFWYLDTPETLLELNHDPSTGTWVVKQHETKSVIARDRNQPMALKKAFYILRPTGQENGNSI